jgi:ribose transport system substrate-binding protein
MGERSMGKNLFEKLAKARGLAWREVLWLIRDAVVTMLKSGVCWRGVRSAAATAMVIALTHPAAAAEGSTISRQDPHEFAGPSTKAKAGKGIRVAIVVCGAAFSGCMTPAKAAAEAGSKIGWTVQILDGGANQQRQNAAILDAVSAKYDVIVTTSIDPNFVQTGLAAAKKAGIPVLSVEQGLDTPNPVVLPQGGNLGFDVDVGINFPEVGKLIGQWIIADSGGKANVVIYGDDEYVSGRLSAAAVLDALKGCNGCTIEPVQQFTASQVATTLGQQVVGYLRSHPRVNYIYVPYDPAATAMVTAIAQAGLGNRVKLTSFVCFQQNMDFIRQGRIQVADGCQDSTYLGYAVIDQAVRILNKQPLATPHGENTPLGLVDKTNLPPAGQDWLANFDYKTRFLELWK